MSGAPSMGASLARTGRAGTRGALGGSGAEAGLHVGYGLAERGVLREAPLDRSQGVHDRRVIAATELLADAVQGRVGVLPAEVHRELARHGDAHRASGRGELAPREVKVLAHLRDDPLEARASGAGDVRAERLSHKRQPHRVAGERGEGLEAGERALELAHVRAPAVGEVRDDRRVEAEVPAARLALDQRHAELGVGSLDVGVEPRGETTPEVLLETRLAWG